VVEFVGGGDPLYVEYNAGLTCKGSPIGDFV
jgi:hypothetical protein